MWINEKLNLAKSQFMDGINIDIEQMVAEGSLEYHALTALVKESTEAFHREIPGSQVWRLACRCYSQAADLTATNKSLFIYVIPCLGLIRRRLVTKLHRQEML